MTNPPEHRPGSILRIIDASANRAREGMRVVEDYARLILANEHVSAAARDVRHGVTSLVKEVTPGSSVLAERDTEGDLGADPETFAPGTRAGVEEIVTSAFKRAQEALRSLAEFSRPLSNEASTGFERLRYKLYDLEKTALAVCAPRARLSAARLGVQVISSIRRDDLLALVEAGAAMVVLDGTGTTPSTFVAAVVSAREACHESGALVIALGRSDVARAANADGVLLGADDLMARDARTVVGSSTLVGRLVTASGFDLEAEIENSDFLVMHTGAPGVDLNSLRGKLPNFLIGSHTEDGIRELRSAGAERVIFNNDGIVSVEMLSRAARALDG